ncbi:phenylacetate--CoA ligase family protein [Accumulibacter sp.]|uniref:phenylacetate--CoA ligase family protein n=1 Tax=Accumulibacter sp. TaxID=2053492 RepID=UPI0025FF3197|nr:phenylacetate--CoA ligase family protein [Accumulibacter sp.]MCM8595403.1 phenylacetate--CoA ligase family protein [Accumulibacter sp.]MCM8626416.1 phenylacetate--CoA ligase family protein [Accumulibacter sp.]MDS4049550.1 phenylacetate--CoA ligase family protein [Accumulibacter sp.]
MNLYTAVCSHLLFPLHERLKGHQTVAVLKRLEQSQWWPAERIEEDRKRRLRAFLGEVGRRVPYYRDLFRSTGFDPQSVRATADLQALPLLDKPAIRANVERLKAEGHGPLTRYNTGGSSGEPLIFFMGKGRKSHDVAAKWRATRWWNVDIGDRELVVWGSPIELGAQDRVRRLRDALLRSHLLPAFEMSANNLDRFVETIRALRPAMLFGYPSSLSLIARHARDRGIEMSGLGIRVAFVTSEKLYDEQRQLIGEVFGCPVANGYGARDAGFIAHQCPAGSLHVSAEDIVVETLRPDGQPTAPGDAGEIVVTHLATADFPFVRYRTGDVGILGTRRCACGRGLPVLDEVQGRTTDFVVARDGTVMHGLALIYTVRDLPGVERFRIEQLSLDRTVVRLVAGPAFDRSAEERIVRDFKARLGESVDIGIERVPEIVNESSGKYRYVVSRVKAFAVEGDNARG